MDRTKILFFWFNRKDCARFISHQWAGLDHPDPTLEQFRAPGLEKKDQIHLIIRDRKHDQNPPNGE